MAIASAKVAYQMYGKTLNGERRKRLADKGACPQWLLWASTSTKDPDYRDVKYVEPLIGPETVNTVPMETLDACRDHVHPRARIKEDTDHARQVLAQLPRLGLDLDKATQQLENEGIEKFCKPFDALLETLKQEPATA